MLEKLLEKIKSSLRIWMHINFLKVNGGVDPCAALRARVARLEEHGTKLLEACECADCMGDLTEHVSGDLMFNFRRALEEDKQRLADYAALRARYNEAIENGSALSASCCPYQNKGGLWNDERGHYRCGYREKHNALRDAVEWERETYEFWEFGRTYTLVANNEALESMFAARAEVDRLIANEGSADCEGKG